MVQLFKKKNEVNPYVEQVAALRQQIMVLQKAVVVLSAEVGYLSEVQRGKNPSSDAILEMSASIEDMLHMNGGY